MTRAKSEIWFGQELSRSTIKPRPDILGTPIS